MTKKYKEMFRGVTEAADAGDVVNSGTDTDSNKDTDDSDSFADDSDFDFMDGDEWETPTALDAIEPRLEAEVPGAAANEMAVHGL